MVQSNLTTKEVKYLVLKTSNELIERFSSVKNKLNDLANQCCHSKITISELKNFVKLLRNAETPLSVPWYNLDYILTKLIDTN